MIDDTWAWIVAIQHYFGENSTLNLSEPVGNWALDLAEHLLALNVRPSNIVLCVSLDDGVYRQRLASLRAEGVTVLSATQGDIQNALRRLHGAGTLLMYWIGHGIMGPSKRYLLCEDSSESTGLRAISVDSLLTRLRSREFPRTQIGFFDCCAQRTANPSFITFDGAGNIGTRQFCYFAAAAAEMTPSEVRPDSFSGVVLDAVKSVTEWPPEPEAMFDGLRQKLKELPMGSRPFAVQFTQESGEFWSYLPFRSGVNLWFTREYAWFQKWIEKHIPWKWARICAKTLILIIALGSMATAGFELYRICNKAISARHPASPPGRLSVQPPFIDNFGDSSGEPDKDNWVDTAGWKLDRTGPSTARDRLVVSGTNVGRWKRPNESESLYYFRESFAVYIENDHQKTVDWAVRIQESERGLSYYHFSLEFPTAGKPEGTLNVTLVSPDHPESRPEPRPVNLGTAVIYANDYLYVIVEGNDDLFNISFSYVHRAHDPNYSNPLAGTYNTIHVSAPSTPALKWGTNGFIGPTDRSSESIQRFCITTEAASCTP